MALLLCQLNVFVVCMPPFQTGIWVQSEPTTLALFIGAALTALWLAAGCAKRWLAAPAALPPLVQCLLAWVLLQILVTPTAQLPWRSWFGPPQTGDGTAMWIAILLVAFMAGPLWQVVEYRRLILRVTAASLIVQCALHAYYPEVPGNTYMPDRWIPAQWPEYLPFLGGYLWVAAFSCGSIASGRNYALAALGMVLLLIDSCNKSANALFLTALAVITLAQWMPLSPAMRRWLAPKRAWRIAMMAACVLPFTLVLISPEFPSPKDGQDAAGPVSSGIDINNGFGSRMLLDRVSMSAIAHEPGRLLWGHGWGTFTDDLFKYGLVDGVYTYRNGVRAPNWFLVEGSSHHSHNQPLEALLSLGVIGLLLWYAIPLLALWTLPEQVFWPCAPMIAALTGLAHFWFQLPQCFPYQALFLASLVSACAYGSRPGIPALPPARYACAFALAALAMLASAAGQYRAMAHAERLHNAIGHGSYKDYSENRMYEDLRYGADRWATSARFYAVDASTRGAHHQLDDNILGWYTYFMHTAHKAAQDPRVGARASSQELRLQYYLFGGFDDPLFDQLRHEATLEFEDAAIRMIHKAPLRDDYTSFFLINLPEFAHHDAGREVQILHRILAVAPNNRGALWMLGKILYAVPETRDKGRSLLQQAIDSHVERAFPVTDAELRATQGELSR